MRNQQRFGITCIEVTVMLACTLALLAITAMVFAGDDAAMNVHKKTRMDAAQASQIHKALIIYANDNEGKFMIPGLVNRLAVGDDQGPQLAGQQIPGMGQEDESRNTTADMYSAMIAQQFFTPDLVVSPVERNPHVKVDKDYDFDAYNPAEDTYWDSKFTADLKTGSNTSYAHQPIIKRTAAKVWSNQMFPDLAQLGNRGPKDGKLDPDSYTCGPHGNWAGNIVFGDNHTEFLQSTTRNGDNLFKADERDNDSLLVFTKLVKDGKLELQFD